MERMLTALRTIDKDHITDATTNTLKLLMEHRAFAESERISTRFFGSHSVVRLLEYVKMVHHYRLACERAAPMRRLSDAISSPLRTCRAGSARDCP